MAKYKEAKQSAKKVVKAVAGDNLATQEAIDAADIELELANKRMSEIQLAYKMNLDDYNRRVAEAAAAQQAALDAAKAVKLSQDEELELLQEFGAETVVEQVCTGFDGECTVEDLAS